MPASENFTRRKFFKQTLMGGCGLALTVFTLDDMIDQNKSSGQRVGFRNDHQGALWKWSRTAEWYEQHDEMVRCNLCPHACILGENDRGFCRTRVVKKKKLYTIAYGNPCAVHVDPVEKKPLYHFLPGSSILSVATAGCNLRCLNCQNWEISQSRPEDITHFDIEPSELTETVKKYNLPSIAYTYNEPLIFYEYVHDTASLAHEQHIKNVLVTAGYIEEKPLRKLCRVVDAANVDLKGFTDNFYKKVTGSRLEPILRGLKTMRQEGVWLEITRLVVPTLSDDLDDIKSMCEWLIEALGQDTPLHFSRFHPAYKLQNLPVTPLDIMEKAYNIAKQAGLNFVYVGNVPGSPHQDTICPNCGRKVIKRIGYTILENQLQDDSCPCGKKISGVWS